MKIENTSKYAALILSAALSCGYAILAKRDYDRYPQARQEIAYYNLERMLGQICSDFSIDQVGFLCGRKNDTGYFTWKELNGAKCKGFTVTVYGMYDKYSFNAYVEQCQDIAEAFNIYIEERDKKDSH
ncbi:MAG: hypothetical protein Q7K45_03120 [Nanoarchaeota archaeon]|nr:hypothetical protein [Nanoarchaeota archaeon]